jgi:hypothetical protein
VEAVHVVQPAISGFGDHRAGPALIKCIVLCLPVNDRIADNSYGMCIGNSNRTFEHAALIHPGGAGHFAVAVKCKCAGKNRFMVPFSARVNDGHSSSGGWTFNNGSVPNGHAGNVSNGIVNSRRAFKWNPQIAGAWLGHISPLYN